jgi:hypothetical protein
MKPHSAFLRSECILPECLDLLTYPVGEHWKRVEGITAPVLDTMIRRAGWHFMWGRGSCVRKGFGMTGESATNRALARALKGISRQFNAAELDSAMVAKHLGFYVARVTVQPRQIRQHTLLDVPEENHAQFALVR